MPITGATHTAVKKKSNCIEVYEKRTFITSVIVVNTGFWSPSLVLSLQYSKISLSKLWVAWSEKQVVLFDVATL